MTQRTKHFLYLKRDRVLLRYVLALLLVLLSGCSDNSIVTIYDKSIASEKIECLQLLVFPPNEMIETTLKNQYEFKKDCAFILEVFTKGNIHCNSNQNSQTKALGAMPSSYLRMDVSKENKKFYSYYIDIKDEIKNIHIENGFLRMQKDLKIIR